MRILLDSNSWLWWLNGDSRLSPDVTAAVRDASSEVFFSAASMWEIAIKVGLGKLVLNLPLQEVHARLGPERIIWLPVEAAHCLRVAQLPWHHRDPFDRLLVAQAQAESLTIASSDSALDDYGIPRLW